MDNPATPPDLAKRGHVTPQGSVVEQTRLDEAWRALRAEVPTIEARIDAGTLDRDSVIDVLCAATLRVLRNPEGLKSAGGSVDDYQESWSVADSTLDMYFTKAELRRLAPPAPGLFTGSIRYGT